MAKLAPIPYRVLVGNFPLLWSESNGKSSGANRRLWREVSTASYVQAGRPCHNDLQAASGS
jgi:hypothetical protein